MFGATTEAVVVGSATNYVRSQMASSWSSRGIIVTASLKSLPVTTSPLIEGFYNLNHHFR